MRAVTHLFSVGVAVFLLWPSALRSDEKILSQVTETLRKAERVEVFRLNPSRLEEDGKKAPKEFHGYEILLERRVDQENKRKELAAFLGKSFHWYTGLMALCFNPRHGLRAHCGKQTFDFLICFECSRVDVYEGDKLFATFALTAVKDNPLDQFVNEAEKKPKEKKQP